MPWTFQGHQIGKKRPWLKPVRKNKYDNDDYIWMGHILNGMSDTLFDMYQNSGSAKELWEKLEARYMMKGATSKKFLFSRFNKYKMVDSRHAMEQMHELEHILNNYKQHNMHMDEIIIVSLTTNKLPLSLKDFEISLKHCKEYISLEQLGNHLCLEEEYHKEDNTKELSIQEKVDVMEKGTYQISPWRKGGEILVNLMKTRVEMVTNKEKRNEVITIVAKPRHFKNKCRF